MIIKTPFEEIFLYREFRRQDGNGWLCPDETISNASVSITDAAGTDVTNDMLVMSSVYTNTKVIFKLMAGETGQTYKLDIRITSSMSQKLEYNEDLRII